MNTYTQPEVDYIVKMQTGATELKGSCLALLALITGILIGALLIYGFYNWNW